MTLISLFLEPKEPVSCLINEREEVLALAWGPEGKCSPTYDQEDGEANDEKRGTTDNYSTSKFDKGWKQKGGPKKEVQQSP